MMKQLAEGVNLHILPTEKYKTVRIFIRFTTRLSRSLSTKRTLLSSLLETNSLNYPDQTQVSAKLAELYGASFGMNVTKKGNLHWLNVGMSLVNGEYVGDQQLFSQAVAFLHEMLFLPNIKEAAFDEQTFLLEKNNLEAYLASIDEDKQTAASLALQQLYFAEDEDQKTPSFGTIGDLVHLTSEQLATYYQQMMAEDQIDIFVIGDVKPAEVLQEMKQLPFTDRHPHTSEFFYYQPKENLIREGQKFESVTQAKLNVAYNTGIYYNQPARFPLMVFNGLFGGFPHSKLFMNVREKASLAYYASSSIDTFRGYMSVQTGIDGTNRDRVLKLIRKQLESLCQGEISEDELRQTKAMLKNQYLLSLDAPQVAIENAFLSMMLPETAMSDEDWIAKLEAVTIQDIQQVAQQIKLQAIFFLDRSTENE